MEVLSRSNAKLARGRRFRPHAMPCRSVSHGVRSHAHPPANRPSRPSRSPHRRPGVTGDVELFSRAGEHCFGRADFAWRMAVAASKADDDNGRLQVHEIVAGIGITGDGIGRGSIAGRRMGRRDPSARPASPRRTPRRPRPTDIRRLHDWRWRRFPVDARPPQSWLTSTAKASPSTQRPTTVSNSLRSRSLSRKRRGGSWRRSNDRERRGRDPIDRSSGRPH